MLERVEHPNGVVTYQSPLLSGVGVPHAFSTRIGGVSTGPYATLNLADLAKDIRTDPNTNVAENFRRLRQAIGCRRHVRVESKQVHGAGVWVPPAEPVKPKDAPCADAMVTDDPGLMLTVRVADCVPILLSSADGKVVAAVHAGWRGVIAGVIPATIACMRDRLGVNPAGIRVAIGPCISTDHFEVGQEVVKAFEAVGLGHRVHRDDWPKPHIDLRSATENQLYSIALCNVDTTDRCTYRDADEFFSHRRDAGQTGRMAAVIAARSTRDALA